MKGALSFSGGKDCLLSLIFAVEAGINVTHLVTFSPKKNPVFKAHPYEIMEIQAEKLNLPLEIIEVDQPYEKYYQEGLLDLNEKYGIEVIITGDMELAKGFQKDWMTEQCKGTNGKVEVYQPLWNMDRERVLEEIMNNNMKTVISAAKSSFDYSWIGKEINQDNISELINFAEKHNIDIAGEDGKYHSMVVDHPYFSSKVEFDFEVECDKNMYYMIIKENFDV